MLIATLSRIRRDKHLIPYETHTQIHAHDELTYFLSGTGVTHIRDKEYTYTPRTFAYYRKGTPHDEVDPNPCETIWTHFSFQIEGTTLREGLFSDPRGELFPLLQKLRRLALEENRSGAPLIEACLAEVILTASRLQNAPDEQENAIDWGKVLDEVDENIHTDVDFSALAARYHYSYDRFRHLFREKFGVAPHAYLLCRRLERAELLLTTTDARLTDVAYDAGFGSSSQFTNLFKKHRGVTPGEYRKASRLTKM